MPLYVPVLSIFSESRRLDCGKRRISLKSSPIARLPRLEGITARSRNGFSARTSGKSTVRYTPYRFIDLSYFWAIQAQVT